jgi:hypothetical protein
MTDRYHTLTVVLEEDIREDDAEGLIAAIGHMRGVLDVTGVVTDLDSHMAEVRVRQELSGKVLDLARELMRP